MTFNGEALDSSQTYQSLGIHDGSVITVVISKGVGVDMNFDLLE